MKKRRVWWIAGGLATALALFVLVAFILDYNSPDSKFERAVTRAVEEYGFELMTDIDERILVDANDPRVKPYSYGIVEMYSRPPMHSEPADQLVAEFRNEFPKWEHDHITLAENGRLIENGDEDAWFEHHRFVPPNDYEGQILYFDFYPDDKGVGGEVAEPIASVGLIRLKHSTWERIKGLWPW